MTIFANVTKPFLKTKPGAKNTINLPKQYRHKREPYSPQQIFYAGVYSSDARPEKINTARGQKNPCDNAV